jgi:GAF domain-containing protein
MGDWTGRWEGKDLITQRCEVLPLARPGRNAANAARLPPDEAMRLAALRRVRLLDSPSSPAYDRVTRMAANTLAVPIVLVSLIDERRQWFMSRVGLDITETSRDISFCAHVVEARETLYVRDTHLDSRFVHNPLVKGDPHIRSYVGVPIFSNTGFAFGALCVMDRKPRDFNRQALDILGDYAAIIQDLVRAREKEMQTQKGA